MVFTVHRPCHPCGSGPQGLTSCLLWNYRIYSTGETIPPGAPADERSPSSRPATGVALGDRLLSRLRIHHEAVRGVVLRRAGGSELGAEGAPVVEGGAAGDLPGVALGGGPAAAEDHHVGGQAGTIPQCLRLLAEADALGGLPGLSPGPPADRQRGDGGGVQDGVHPAAEAVGDDVESGERPVDRRPAGDPLEWGLERGVSILPGIESDTPNADSRDYTEAKGLKCRIIAGTGAITPELPDVLVAELLELELDKDVTLQDPMIEDQVDEPVVVPDE